MEPQGLWERAERLRSAADEAARLAQNIYVSFLLLGTYIAIIIGSTTDVQLLKVSPVTLARNEHSCHNRQSRVFSLSGCAINLRFEHPVFHPILCYFKVLFACATSRATINVPPDLCYERFWHRPFW
jgi:hypothetical protein